MHFSEGYFDKKFQFWVAVVLQAQLQVSPSLAFKILAPASFNQLDPFYGLQHKFIERNCKATFFTSSLALPDQITCQAFINYRL